MSAASILLTVRVKDEGGLTVDVQSLFQTHTPTYISDVSGVLRVTEKCQTTLLPQPSTLYIKKSPQVTGY